MLDAITAIFFFDGVWRMAPLAELHRYEYLMLSIALISPSAVKLHAEKVNRRFHP